MIESTSADFHFVKARSRCDWQQFIHVTLLVYQLLTQVCWSNMATAYVTVRYILFILRMGGKNLSWVSNCDSTTKRRSFHSKLRKELSHKINVIQDYWSNLRNTFSVTLVVEFRNYTPIQRLFADQSEHKSTIILCQPCKYGSFISL